MYSLTKRLLLFSLWHAIWMTPELFATAELANFPDIAATTLQKTAEESPPQRAIAFNPPPEWLMADTKELPPSVKVMFVGHGKGAFPPSINLGMEEYHGTLKQYLKTIKAINSSQGGQLKELGPLQTPAGEGHLYQEDSSTRWGEVRMMHLILQKEGTIYMLTAAAAKEEFSTYYKRFFESMSSLHFIDTKA